MTQSKEKPKSVVLCKILGEGKGPGKGEGKEKRMGKGKGMESGLEGGSPIEEAVGAGTGPEPSTQDQVLMLTS